MKKILLFFVFVLSVQLATAQCNFTLLGTSTSVVSSNTTADSAYAASSYDSILVCTGNTLTYDYIYEYKRFFVTNGATLIIKKIQQCEVYLEAGATLQIDTVGSNFVAPMITTIHFDSTNVTLVDTNQFYGANTTWVHCSNNTFNYTMFNAGPCNPLSVVDNSLSVLVLNFENPVRDQIKLNQFVLDKAHSAQIIDITGKVVRDISSLTGLINVSSLPQGIYILKLESEKRDVLVKKFFKD